MANPLYGQNKADNALANQVGEFQRVGADITLTDADAGKCILFTPPAGAGALDITLPAHKEGLRFMIIQESAYDTAVCNVASADGNDFIGSITAATGDGDTAAGTDDKVVFGSGTVAGDFIEVMSTGLKWCIINSSSKVTSNGVAFG